MARLALRPTQTPIKWVLGAISPGVKQQGHEANHSTSPTAEVKNDGAIPPLPPYGFMELNYFSLGKTLTFTLQDL
jgi:hypothetical protein